MSGRAPTDVVQVQESASPPPVADAPLSRVVRLVSIGLLIGAALACLASLGVGLADIYMKDISLRTALSFVAALLFIMVFVQAAMHLTGAPLRQRMVSETSKVVEEISTNIAERLDSPAAKAASPMLGRVAATIAQWVVFFGSRAAVAGLLGAVSSALLGVLTVAVAYQQVVLLDKQSAIMRDQTQVMTADNNARTRPGVRSSLLQLTDDP